MYQQAASLDLNDYLPGAEEYARQEILAEKEEEKCKAIMSALSKIGFFVGGGAAAGATGAAILKAVVQLLTISQKLQQQQQL